VTDNVIKLTNIVKEFDIGKDKLKILNAVNLNIKKGEFISIMGASGSGKSTLLNIIGCLDRPSSGSYQLGDRIIDELSDDELALIRNKELGFVFQTFNLLPYYTAIRNVEVPLSYSNRKDRREVAEKLLESVGLGHRTNHKPSEMSGGEKQRIAIARALSTNPSVILADEPTGSLDSRTGQEIMGIFNKLHSEGKTIIMVTHDKEVAANAERIIVFKDGGIVDELA